MDDALWLKQKKSGKPQAVRDKRGRRDGECISKRASAPIA